jgi:hypothetical protein
MPCAIAIAPFSYSAWGPEPSPKASARQATPTRLSARRRRLARPQALIFYLRRQLAPGMSLPAIEKIRLALCLCVSVVIFSVLRTGPWRRYTFSGHGPRARILRTRGSAAADSGDISDRWPSARTGRMWNRGPIRRAARADSRRIDRPAGARCPHSPCPA